MDKNIKARTMSILLIFSLAGCATDQQLTKTQGTGIGAGVGAAAGGALGALVGALTGNRENIGRFAAIGAGAGLLAGGVAGYNWGSNVARKKGEYANAEDYLDASIADARATTQAAASENANLRKDIARYDQLTKQLIVLYQQGQANRQNLISSADEITQRRAKVQQKIEHTTQQITIARQQLAEAGSGPTSAAKTQKLAELNGQIQAMTAQKAELEAHNLELAQISNRIGV